MTDDELEQTKARNRAWMEFAKQPENPVEEMYLRVGEDYQRILSIGDERITTSVDGVLHQYPVEGVEVVRWSELPPEAHQLSWVSSVPREDT